MADRVVVVVRVVSARPCSGCDRPIRKADRIYVRSQLGRKGGRPLSFGVGAFCSTKCVLRFAAQREAEGLTTIRGWTFGKESLR